MAKPNDPKPKNATLVDTGKLLSDYIAQHRIRQSALARKIKRAPKTIYAYKKRSTMQCHVLLEICEGLNYNFFSDIAALLPGTMPAAPTAKDKRIEELEKELATVKNERDNLQKVIDILGKK